MGGCQNPPNGGRLYWLTSVCTATAILLTGCAQTQTKVPAPPVVTAPLPPIAKPPESSPPPPKEPAQPASPAPDLLIPDNTAAGDKPATPKATVSLEKSGEAGIEGENAGGQQEQQTGARVDVTPFTAFESQWSSAGGRGGIFKGNYTRVLITAIDIPENGNAKNGLHKDANAKWISERDKDTPDLPYKSRHWLERWLVGKDFAINLTLGVEGGLYKASVPIVTLSHKSNAKEGERWNRSIEHTLGLPLFLVESSSPDPKLTFTLKGSVDYRSSIAAEAVNLAREVAKGIAPQSTVVTKLSAPALESRANALDNAISQLFGMGLTENQATQNPVWRWRYDKGFAISLSIPANESNFSSEGKLGIGSWLVTFEEPRPSIFAEWKICPPESHDGWASDSNKRADLTDGTSLDLRCAESRDAAIRAVFREVDGDAVLRTPLVSFAKPGASTNELGSISAYLTQRDWYTKAVGELGDTAKAAAAAPEFCRKVRGAIVDVGLSPLDADIVVWAVAYNMPDLPGRTTIQQDATCLKSISPITEAGNE